jgi:hypothetical protein
MKYLTFVCLVLVVTLSSAQEPGPRRDTTNRSSFIKSYPDHFFIWPVLKQRRFDFEMRNLEGGKDKLQYRSNKPYSFGWGVYLFELGVELTFAVPLDEQSKRIYGESKARDFQLNVMGKRWGVNAFVQKYSGFYRSDPSIEVPANTPYWQRPDIVAKNVGLTVNYTFNHKKFSFRSAYAFAERQLTSAGSLIVFATFDDLSVAGDSAIIGHPYMESFGRASQIRRARTTVVAVAPGYTYSIIYKGFFLNGALAIGPGSNWLGYSLEDGGSDRNFNISAFIAARLALGYNGDRLFGGLTFMNIARNAKFDDVELTSNNSSFKILVGYRFPEKGILKKRVLDIPKSLFN